MRNRSVVLTRVRLTVLGAALALFSLTGLATTKGPDSGGYTGTDETIFSFIDVSSSGGVTTLGGIDDGVAPLTLPFAFAFYDAAYSMVCASSNGAAYFVNAEADCPNGDFANTDLSSTAPPGNRPGVFPMWMDLRFEGTGAGVVYKTIGEEGSRKFVIQWNRARPVTVNAPLTFQVILFEGTNQILFQYETVGIDGNPAGNGGLATVGIRDQNGHVTLREIAWSFNAPVLADGKAILFNRRSTQSTLTVTGPSSITFGTTGTATSTGGSGSGALTYSTGGSTGCSIVGTTVSVVNASQDCSLNATKAGDDNYEPTTSAPFAVTLQKAAQTIVFTSTPPAAPTVGGPAYVVTATGGGSGNPVTFGTSSSACNVSGNTVTFVAAGSCVVAANQVGNDNYLAAPQVTQSMTVSAGGGALATTTDLVSLPNPSQFSDPVLLTARVHRGVQPIGAGTVTFKEGATVLAANVPVNPLGLALFTSSSLSVGTHAITAFYSGTSSFAPSSGSVNHTVKKAKTNAALVSNRNPSNRNQNVTFTVTVTHNGSAVTAGTVTFKEGSTILAGPLALDASGKASFSKSNLSQGSHAITAAYAGTANYESSSDSLTQVVRR